MEECCRGPLEANLVAIVREAHLEAIGREAFEERDGPQVQLLLHIAPEELDRLHVPLETPHFYELPPETRRILVASLQRQYQMQRHGETRRRLNLIAARSLATRGEEPLRAELHETRIRELLRGFNAYPIGTVNRRQEDDNMDIEEENVMRVSVEHRSRIGEEMDALLGEISLHFHLLHSDTFGLFRRPSHFIITSRSREWNNSTEDEQTTPLPPRRHFTYGVYRSFALYGR